MLYYYGTKEVLLLFSGRNRTVAVNGILTLLYFSLIFSSIYSHDKCSYSSLALTYKSSACDGHITFLMLLLYSVLFVRMFSCWQNFLLKCIFYWSVIHACKICECGLHSVSLIHYLSKALRHCMHAMWKDPFITGFWFLACGDSLISMSSAHLKWVVVHVLLSWHCLSSM